MNQESLHNAGVRRIYLESSGDRWEISSFRCTWAINSIPRCTCVLSEGVDVIAGGRKQWENADPDKEWSLYVDAGKIKRVIFRGVVRSSTVTAYPGTTKGSKHVTLGLMGNIGKLDEASSSKFAYINRGTGVTDEKSSRPVLESGKQSMNSTVANLLVGPDNMRRIKELTGYKSIDIHARDDLGKFSIATAAIIHDGLTGKETLDPPISSYFDPRDKIAFKPDSVPLATVHKAFDMLITKSMVQSYYDNLQNASLLAALRGMLSKFFLGLVPTLDSLVRIKPMFAWKKEGIKLGSNYLLAVEEATDMAGLSYVPDMVQVDSMLPSRKKSGAKKSPIFMSIWPDPLTIEKQGVLKKAITVLPDWAAAHLRREFGDRKSEDRSKGALVKSGEKPAEGKEDQAASEGKVESTCNNYAKVYFANMANADVKLKLTLHWEMLETIMSMLGGVVELDLPNTPYMGISGKRYGYLLAVSLAMGVSPQAGSATLTATLSHVRDAGTNDKWAVEEHPFYSVKVASGK